MKKIVYIRSDGGLSVVHPAPQFLAQFETEEEGLNAVIAKSVPADATEVEVVERTILPTSRAFRNAWRRSPGGVDVNMPAARTIHMDRIREVRNERLGELDRDWMKETGRGRQSEAAAIEAKREELRQVPQAFDLSSATTPEELEALWPTSL